MGIELAKHFRTAFEGYDDVLRGFVAGYEKADLLELGAGRKPSFGFERLPDTVASYTLNDVSADELALSPEGYEKACFNVSGDASAFSGRYDVVFSRFLAEHVPDGQAMHRNVFSVLKPGGVAFHLIPTLYASPFVLNLLLPERVSHRLLTVLRPWRKTAVPKFVAPYSWCYGDGERMRKMLADIGYRRIEIRQFYGHSYYERLPLIRDVEGWLASQAAKRDWTWYGAFAYIIATK